MSIGWTVFITLSVVYFFWRLLISRSEALGEIRILKERLKADNDMVSNQFKKLNGRLDDLPYSVLRVIEKHLKLNDGG